MKWNTDIKNLIQTGNTSVEVYLKSTAGGSLSDINLVEKRHPGYLHEPFRHSTNTIGCKESFFEIESCMNKRSLVDMDARDAVNLTRYQVNNWFNDNGGKEISPVEKPLDTSEHKKMRLDWVRNHITKLSSLLYYVAYLDEKFFYTTSRHRKLK